jgi:FAD:protein FMN transferase
MSYHAQIGIFPERTGLRSSLYTHLLAILLIFITATGCQEAPMHNTGAPSSIAYFTGTAMTIDYNITIGSTLSSEQQQSIKKIIETTFADIDNIYNKWNPVSELSLLNNAKAHVSLPLSPMLERFLFQTQQIVEISNGLFDPTIEPLQKLWKKHLQKGRIPTEE